MKLKYIIVFAIAAIAFGCSSANKGSGLKGPVSGNPWNLTLPGNTLLPMSWIRPGTFTMGSPETEHGRKPDESPRTVVTLTHGYWMANTEVTIGQWKAITGLSLRDKVNKILNDETLYDFEDGKKHTIREYMHFEKNAPDKIMANEDDQLPMYLISWNEAMDFCRKLTLRERANGNIPKGYEYTLPTEAQYEYACRAGSTGATYVLAPNVPTTNATMNGVGWFGANSKEGYKDRGLGPTQAGPHDVGTKPPNAWGLYDMLGNIWEWCRDWYGPYPGGNVTDPVGPPTGVYRVNRGGSWGIGLYDERSANRAKNPPNEDSAWRGFRIVLSAVQ